MNFNPIPREGSERNMPPFEPRALEQTRGYQCNRNITMLLPQNSFIQVRRTQQPKRQKKLISEVSENFLISYNFQGNPEFCATDVSVLRLPLCVIIFNQMQSSLLTSYNALVPGALSCSCAARGLVTEDLHLKNNYKAPIHSQCHLHFH